MGTHGLSYTLKVWLFQAVAEERHFGRAAQRLGMSQPPLTEQIKALEQSLGTTLFVRDRRGVRLTAAGAAILPAVGKFVEQAGRLELAVREAVAGRTGTLTIGAINPALVEDIPPLVAALRTAHPGLTVAIREIDSVEAVPALEAGASISPSLGSKGYLGQRSSRGRSRMTGSRSFFRRDIP
ncbi:LysR family transcriptional regulator [Methylobacterium sp.]|uniref:LysR family transcriptional regulator n=1 Tax=Methylobacterium sp. TaxID=409 RepID=UPI003B02162C